MTQAQVFDEIRRWPPQDKWLLVETLLRDLRMRGGDQTLSGTQQAGGAEGRQVMTLLGSIPALPAAAVMAAAGLFDLEGDALKDTEALYE